MNAARVRRTATILTSIGVLAAALSITSSSTRLAALGGQPVEDDGIAPSARAQIQALLDEKETRTPAERKIDSQLLYARRMEMGLPIAPGVQTLEVYVPHAGDGHVGRQRQGHRHQPPRAVIERHDRENEADGQHRSAVARRSRSIEAIAEQPDVLWVGPKQEAFTSRRDAAPVPPARSIGPRAAPPCSGASARRSRAARKPGFALPAATQDAAAPDDERLHRRHRPGLRDRAVGHHASRSGVPWPDRIQRRRRQGGRPVRRRRSTSPTRSSPAISAPSRCCPDRPAPVTRAPRCSRSFTTSHRARSCIFATALHVDHVVRRTTSAPARRRLRHHRGRRRLLRGVGVPGRTGAGGRVSHQRRRRRPGRQGRGGARVRCTFPPPAIGQPERRDVGHLGRGLQRRRGDGRTGDGPGPSIASPACRTSTP